MGGGGGSGFVYTKDSTATIEAINAKNKDDKTKQYSVDAKYQLTDAKTIAGDKTINIPVHGNYLGSTDAKDLMAGNKGDGFARITRLTKKSPCLGNSSIPRKGGLLEGKSPFCRLAISSLHTPCINHRISTCFAIDDILATFYHLTIKQCSVNKQIRIGRILHPSAHQIEV